MNTLLKCQDIGLTRGPNTVLKDLSFELKGGDCVLLEGENGSGKTSLLAIMAGFLKPTSGEIVVDRHEVSWLPVHERSPFPIVVQDYFAIAGVPQLPQEIAAWAERPLNTLSSGQYQYISLQRFFASSRKVLLLDEPLMHLDLAKQEWFFQKINSVIERGGAVVWSFHTSSVHPKAYFQKLILSKL